MLFLIDLLQKQSKISYRVLYRMWSKILSECCELRPQMQLSVIPRMHPCLICGVLLVSRGIQWTYSESGWQSDKAFKSRNLRRYNVRKDMIVKNLRPVRWGHFFYLISSCATLVQLFASAQQWASSICWGQGYWYSEKRWHT